MPFEGPAALAKGLLGLQFHGETTNESVMAPVENAAGDIGEGPCGKPLSTILAGIGRCAVIRSPLDRVLDNLTGFAREGK